MKQKKINQIEPLISKSDINAINEYLNKKNWITENKYTKNFEQNFSEVVGSKFAVAFPNGTLTLLGILKALNLQKNSFVLVPNITMVATATAVSLAGLSPLFVDVEKESLCMCPKDLKKKIKKNVSAVIYVTLNGRSGSIDKIKKICSNNKKFLIEDSAHSIGCFFKKKHHGNFGIASSFSFSMPKIITTGQGGMIVTNSNKIFKKLKLLKNFGRSKSGEDNYISQGYNFKFTDLQAVLGLNQLKNIKERIDKKKKIFNFYYKKLNKVKEIKFLKFNKNETPWFIDIYIKDKKKLKNYLMKKNILTRDIYPPLNKLNFFNQKSLKLPVSTFFSERGLWLPSSLNLTQKNLVYITNNIKKFYEN
jgi:perosamine synthetase